MANHESAKKAYKQSQKKNLRNKSRASRIKTCIKKVLAAVDAKNIEEAQGLFKVAQSEIARGVKGNVMKANTASRRISKLALKVKNLAA